MRANYILDKDNRIQSITTFPIEESIDVFDFPDNFPDRSTLDYKIIGKELVYDPLPPTPEPEPTESSPTWSELAAVLKEGVNDV